MNWLLREVRDAIEKRGLLRAGERVGVAVSGGADSVALLLLLVDLRKELGIVLTVAHFNHKLRGRHSQGDEKFVAELAAKHHLLLHTGEHDVRATAKRNKANLEDTARRVRYEFLESLVTSGKVDEVVVAHTADDQAETVLAHILRGTGLAGLGGIHPEVGHVARPLLGVRRADLRAYLKAKKQGWREDATNRDLTRMRARIRKKLMPILEKQFQPAVVKHLAALAELARGDEACIEALVEEYARTCVERAAGSTMIRARDLVRFTERAAVQTATSRDKAPFEARGKETQRTQRTRRNAEAANFAVGGRMVRRMVREIKPRAGEIGAGHVRAVLDLAENGENGKCLQLPGGVEVRREHDSLIFCVPASANKSRGRAPVEFRHEVQLEGGAANIRVPQLSCVFRFRVIDWPAKRGDTIPTGLVLDCDALQSPLVLRNWRPGDRLRPSGHRSEHKLKRLLSKKRVSRWERSGWPVLASGQALVWARGFPVAAEFAADDKTRSGLVITEEPIS